MTKTVGHGKTKARPKRGDALLKTAVQTAHYEYSMFCQACVLTQRPPSPDEEHQVLRNMAIEVAVLHARNLRDFFTRKGRDDDVLAADFLRSVPPWKLTKLKSKSVRRRMNKLLAHMSFKRRRYKKGWDIPSLKAEIDRAWQMFLDRLEEESPKVRHWFREKGH